MTTSAALRLKMRSKSRVFKHRLKPTVMTLQEDKFDQKHMTTVLLKIAVLVYIFVLPRRCVRLTMGITLDMSIKAALMSWNPQSPCVWGVRGLRCLLSPYCLFAFGFPLRSHRLGRPSKSIRHLLRNRTGSIFLFSPSVLVSPGTTQRRIKMLQIKIQFSSIWRLYRRKAK